MNADSSQSIAEELALVADQRRERVREGIEKVSQPAYIKQVIQTEVSYVIHPNALPYAQANIESFSESLKELYGLQFDSNPTVDDDNPLSRILGHRQREGLRFENGRFRVSSHDFIPIKKVDLTDERIHLVLRGPSAVADAIIADVVERLWASAGANKPWDQIYPMVQLKQFGTSTEVDLGFPLEDLLSDRIKSFLSTNCLAGESYAKEMAPKLAINGFEKLDRINASYVVDGINLLFNLYDPQSGHAYQAKLQIVISAKYQYGGTTCLVISELPYEQHVQCVGAMIRELRQ
jgi:hypothetical protein